MRITYELIDVELPMPKLSDAEVSAIKSRLSKVMDMEIEKAFAVAPAPPPVEVNPRCCYGVILHEPNCPSWGCVT